MFRTIILIFALATANLAQAQGLLLSNLMPNFGKGSGGFSSLEITGNGSKFISVSDKGQLVAGSISRDNGIMTGITIEQSFMLKDPQGKPSQGRDFDSEGLALDNKGGFYLSLEGPARVWHYASASATPTQITVPEAFANYGDNSSLEALAIDAKGNVLTLPERSGRHSTPFPVYAWNGQSWTVRFQLDRILPFLPVGADFDDHGNLYILERDFQGLLFRSRIRKITPELISTTILNISHDNLEGLSVWRDDQGKLRATMISDNNMHDWLPTRIVEYRLDD